VSGRSPDPYFYFLSGFVDEKEKLFARNGFSMMDGEILIAIALKSKASHAAILDVSQIQFNEEFRKACEKNVCRKYNASWMGPPVIGPVSALKQKVLRFRRGLLFQTIHSLAGNFDFKGMLAAGKVHDEVFLNLVANIRQAYPSEKLLPLNKGCCSLCERCAYLDDEPCRRPDQAAASVEAYGMNVLALQKSAGVPYYHGKSAVCYVGLVLFDFIPSGL
jgi:predicted metal-binding protein